MTDPQPTRGDIQRLLAIMARLRAPVDRFFDIYYLEEERL